MYKNRVDNHFSIEWCKSSPGLSSGWKTLCSSQIPVLASETHCGVLMLQDMHLNV